MVMNPGPRHLTCLKKGGRLLRLWSARENIYHQDLDLHFEITYTGVEKNENFIFIIK